MKIFLERAHLDAPCDLERGMGMSTLIASEEWVIEADYAAGVLGDVRLYRNQDVADIDPKTNERRRGKYWGSVPAHRVKCYRFLHGEPNAEGETGLAWERGEKSAKSRGVAPVST
jgi:hypothetical protein